MSGTPWQATDERQPALVRQANDTARLLQQVADVQQATAQTVVKTIDHLLDERARIAAILAEFYQAPLSLSSVQPVLDLALELTPGMARLKVRT